MDQSWINKPRITDGCERGVEEFIQFTQCNAISNHNGVRMRCSCVNCLNRKILNVFEIREHLWCDRFLKMIQHGRDRIVALTKCLQSFRVC